MSSADKTTNTVHGEQGQGTGLRNPTNQPAMTDRPDVGGARAAVQVSLWQLNLLRVGYLVMGGGLVVVKWPLLFTHGPGSCRQAPSNACSSRCRSWH
jgi:hypothetical protein